MKIEIVLAHLHQQPVAYYPIYAHITGSVTSGVLLSQIMFKWTYWGRKKFFKTDMELRRETGLSDEDMRRAKKAVALLPFLTISREGVPARTHYSVDATLLAEFLSSYEFSPTSSGDVSPTGSGDVSPTGSGDVSPTAIYGRARLNQIPYEIHNKSTGLKPPKPPLQGEEGEGKTQKSATSKRQNKTPYPGTTEAQAQLKTSILDPAFETWYAGTGLADVLVYPDLTWQWEQFALDADANNRVYKSWRAAFMKWLGSKYQERRKRTTVETYGLTDKEYRTMRASHNLIEEIQHDDARRQPALLPGPERHGNDVRG